MALVVGVGEGRGETWQRLVPLLCRATRYLDDRGVETVFIYDVRGVLKSQWGVRELRKHLEGEGSGTGTKGKRRRENGVTAAPRLRCAVKLLSRDDWSECISEAARALRPSPDDGQGSPKASSSQLQSLVEAHAVTGVNLPSASAPLGPPPDLILCFLPQTKAFTLSGFFPWHTKSAEIYKIPLESFEKEPVASRMDRVLRDYFKTKQRFGA